MINDERIEDMKKVLRQGDIIFGKEHWPGHVGIIVDNGKGMEVREAYPGVGVSNISLSDFCKNGSYHPGHGGNYTEIGIYRPHCDPQTALNAARIAQQCSGTYDSSYIGAPIAMVVFSFAIIPELIAASIATPIWKSNWDNNDKWYCSELAYKVYYRAGFDLYPKKKKCFNPFTFALTGEYPYLFGDCPWWVISPGAVIASENVTCIWYWKE